MNKKPVINSVQTFILLLVMLFVNTQMVLADGTTIISADLRVDDSNIQNAGDYRVKIAVKSQPASSFPSYTAGWLGIDLAPKDSLSGPKLVRVGLMADETGVYWFAFSNSPIQCLMGTEAWWSDTLNRYQGCKGSSASIVRQGYFHTVELVTYHQGQWVARVYDDAEMGFDVAVITQSSKTVSDVDINFEESFIQDQDPDLNSAYVFYRPQYNSWEPGVGFVDWPISGVNSKNLVYIDSTIPSVSCPLDYGVRAMYSHPKAWLAGDVEGSGSCDLSLFNQVYLPMMVR